MTAKQKAAMEARVIRDKSLSPGAAILMLRILSSEQFLRERSFALPHKVAGSICGISDKATIYARINQLCTSYLKRAELSGCPPTWKFKIKTQYEKNDSKK